MVAGIGGIYSQVMADLCFKPPPALLVTIGELEVRNGPVVVGRIFLQAEGYRYFHGHTNVLNPSRSFQTLDDAKAFARSSN
jgi:hypothetical protein